MGKYNDWTRGEDEALLNIIGGTDIARAVLRGERKLIVELVAPQPTANQPLVGTVVKTLALKPYKASSVAEAIKLGKYNSVDGDIVTLFAEDEVGLAKAVSVDLVQFDRDPIFGEVVAWGKENKRQPMLSKHLYAIGSQHPEEQRQAPIVEPVSVRHGRVLCLFGDSVWRSLGRFTVERGWRRRFLFGFLSE